MAGTAAAANTTARIVEAITQRHRKRRSPWVGRSRMAAMTLIRLMRMLVIATVRKAMRKPTAKPLMMLMSVTWKARARPPSSAEKLLKIRAATITTARPTPMPTTMPTSDATSA